MAENDNIDLLYRISETISSSLDMSAVLEGVMDEVVKATYAERGFIILTEPIGEAGSSKPEICAQRGIDESTVEGPDFRFSQGVIERVLQSGEPVLTSDAQAESNLDYRESIAIRGLRSILCVPLKTKDKILGAIYVDSRMLTGIFTRTELELVYTIANHAAVSIENARLFIDTQAKLKTLRILYEIMTALTSTLDVESVLVACMERVQSLLNVSTATVLTLEGDELVFKVVLGEKSQELRSIRLKPNEGVAGWVMESGKALIVNNPQSDLRCTLSAYTTIGYTPECTLAVPLIINQRTIGVIEVFNKPSGFDQADLELLSAIGSSTAIAVENARLYQTAVEQGRMERELQVARGVQVSLLPTNLPKLPDWEFAANWLPAGQVSGDYYDAIPLSFHRYGLFVADVTDKGIPAALFMAFTRSIVRASLAEAASPATGITRANRLICSGSSRGLFVTMFYALLDPNASMITWVNAGHLPALHYHATTGRLTRLATTGMPLGMEINTVYRQQKCRLELGDLLLLYTDGITEASNAEQEEYGLERLEAVVQNHGNESTDQLLSVIQDSVKKHAGTASPSDDITVLAIKHVKNAGQGAM